MPPRIVFSSERSGDIRLQIGSAHYSYRFVEQKFVAAMRRHGIEATYVAEPEALKTRQACLALAGAEARDLVHLSFRSTENIRPLPGAINICHFAWEFDVMRDRALLSEPVTANQAHMLRLADEIWPPCRYTQDVLRRHGLPNTHVVPTPVCGDAPPARLDAAEAMRLLDEVPSLPLLLSSGLTREGNADMMMPHMRALGEQPALRAALRGGRVFLTMCNPEDLRKNLLGLIEGFQLAAGGAGRDALIVKLVVSNREDYQATALHERLQPRFTGSVALHDPRVIVLVDFLSTDQMAALYSLADFYVSAAHCEGFNLPLLEAMSYGTVAVATRNTAMADYIDDTVAVVIPEAAYPRIVHGLAGDVAGASYDLPVASRFEVGRAIRRAGALPVAQRAALADAGRARVAAMYGEARTVGLIRERVAALTAARQEQRRAG